MDEKVVKDSQGLVKDLVNDCISRKAAIEKATKDHDFFRGATTQTDKARRDELLNVICWLGELPSAQPEKRTEERTESHACDLIDRAEAIDALRTHERKPSKKWFDNQLDIEWNNAIDICCYDIEDLPSAQPESKEDK